MNINRYNYSNPSGTLHNVMDRQTRQTDESMMPMAKASIYCVEQHDRLKNSLMRDFVIAASRQILVQPPVTKAKPGTGSGKPFRFDTTAKQNNDNKVNSAFHPSGVGKSSTGVTGLSGWG